MPRSPRPNRWPRTRLLIALAGSLIVIGVGAALFARTHNGGAVLDAAAREGANPDAAGSRAQPAHHAKGRWSRYRLTYDEHTAMGSADVTREQLDGTWTVGEHTNHRTEGQLAVEHFVVTGGKGPARDALTQPFVMAERAGLLDGMGFSEGTPNQARNLLTKLATTFQYSVRTGDRWTVAEDDELGRYQADYQRNDATLTRTRAAYTLVRPTSARSVLTPSDVSPEEHSAFVFDANGLLSATVTLSRTMKLPMSLGSMTLTTRATLAREDSWQRPLTDGPDLPIEPISFRVDRSGLITARRTIAEKRVAGASTEDLLSDVEKALSLDPKAAATGKEKAAAIRRLAAATEVYDDAAQKLADAIRREPENRPLVDALTGALQSSHNPVAATAMASLLGDQLPRGARVQVIAELGLAQAPSAATLTALEGQVQGDDQGEAELAIGNETRTLGDGVTGDAIHLLLQMYEDATAIDQRVALLQALGNTGSRLVLPVMLAAISSNMLVLAQAGTMGLRLIPGDDVDQELQMLIQSGSVLIYEAVAAVGYRSPELWTPQLQALLAGLQAQIDPAKMTQAQKHLLDTIQQVLGQWQQAPGTAIASAE